MSCLACIGAVILVLGVIRAFVSGTKADAFIAVGFTAIAVQVFEFLIVHGMK